MNFGQSTIVGFYLFIFVIYLFLFIYLLFIIIIIIIIIMAKEIGKGKEALISIIYEK